jgi:hypothetical protein
MSHTFGENPSKNNTRKAVAIPRRVCVDGPWDEGKKQQSGRFGLMCFSANRNKEDWDICKCDHINGDCFDDREENVRWLTPKENKTDYSNKKIKRVNATRA